MVFFYLCTCKHEPDNWKNTFNQIQLKFKLKYKKNDSSS